MGLVVMFALKPAGAQENKQVAENEALREKLEAAKRELNYKGPVWARGNCETRVEVPTEVGNASPSPQAIIDNLINLDPRPDRTEKRAVFFESLDHGDAALPAIRNFMVNDPLKTRCLPGYLLRSRVNLLEVKARVRQQVTLGPFSCSSKT